MKRNGNDIATIGGETVLRAKIFKVTQLAGGAVLASCLHILEHRAAAFDGCQERMTLAIDTWARLRLHRLGALGDYRALDNLRNVGID